MISVVGATTWGTTLSILLAQKNLPVSLLLRDKHDSSRLTNIPLPPSLKPTTSWDKELKKASLVILAIPSRRLKENLALISPHIGNPTLILSAIKGIDEDSGDTPSQIIARELNEDMRNICVISGPNFAEEIMEGLPAATVLAGERASEIVGLFESRGLKVEISKDIIGVELCGALKNVIAIGAAMVDGLGYGDNAKAAFITKSFKEITSLTLACGGTLETLLSFAGIGDLMLTCYSRRSRNYQLGFSIGRGIPPQDAVKMIRGVVEGMSTAKGVIKLSQRAGVSVQIMESIYRVLFEGKGAREVVEEIL